MRAAFVAAVARAAAKAAAVARAAAATVAAAALALSLAGCGGPIAAPGAAASSHSDDAGDAGRIQIPFSASPAPPVTGVVVTHIDIPAIGVSSDIELLGLDPKGALIPPADFNKAGWYQGGVLPGQVGPAIIAGHVDSVTAPAVFVNLKSMTPGTKIMVTLSDGGVLTFVATRSESALKSQFPSSAVYGEVPTPQLRLITCGGVFNPKVGHYDENLVVFASLV